MFSVYMYMLTSDYQWKFWIKILKMVLCVFQDAVKVVSYYLHISFLGTWKSDGLCPADLSIRKKLFIELKWKRQIEILLERVNSKYTERSFGSMICWLCERMFCIERKFWDDGYELEKNNDKENFKEWLVKLLIHLERKMKKITKVKTSCRNYQRNMILKDLWVIDLQNI